MRRVSYSCYRISLAFVTPSRATIILSCRARPGIFVMALPRHSVPVDSIRLKWRGSAISEIPRQARDDNVDDNKWFKAPERGYILRC